MSEREQNCGVIEASCVCDLPADHDGFHHCECGGEWFIDTAGAFIIKDFPGSAWFDDLEWPVSS